ncbi:MAG: TonB-dependent receptor, partial [Steroidobacteraceae bacterium]
DVQLSGGSFNRRAAAAQYGASSEHLGFYIAGNALDQDGWRELASDSIRQLYAVLGARTHNASLDLSYTGAKNGLAGQGAAPVQELAFGRTLGFTGPQSNLNQLNFVTLNGSFKATHSLSVQALLYYRQYGQTVANGNTTDYTACTNAAAVLCQSDGLTALTTAAGQSLPDISDGGSVPIGENDFERIGADSRGTALQLADGSSIAGHSNRFSAGATFDYATMDFYTGTRVGVIDPQLVVLPSSLIVDTPESSPFGATPVSLQALDQYDGLYATDTFDATPALAFTLSGRYNVAEIELRDRLGTKLTGDNRYEHFNPALGATYRVASALTAYAGFSENARTPTASEIECSNPLQPCLLPSSLAGDPPTLRQVVAQTYELGIRGRTGASGGQAGAAAGTDGMSVLSWNLGLFRTNLYDDICSIATSVSSGFFQNIGSTRRQGVEAGLNLVTASWSAYINYSYIDAAFRSALVLPSPSNPFQDANGNIQVLPGDRMPGIPENRVKVGLEMHRARSWTVGADVSVTGDQYFFGDESNQNAPLGGYTAVDLYGSYRLSARVEFFADIHNLLDATYATYGIYSDPTGVGAPGIPAGASTNGPGVDNRFESPAAPFAAYAGVRVKW